jgi:hypothetical protein
MAIGLTPNLRPAREALRVAKVAYFPEPAVNPMTI